MSLDKHRYNHDIYSGYANALRRMEHNEYPTRRVAFRPADGGLFIIVLIGLISFFVLVALSWPDQFIELMIVFGISAVALSSIGAARSPTVRKYLKKRRRLRRLKQVLAKNKAAKVVANLPVVIQEFLPLVPDKMLLKLKRSQKRKRNGATVFMLDARMDVPPDARDRIARYGLGHRVVYESAERLRHLEAAAGHLAASRNDTSLLAPAGEQAKGALKSFWKIGRAAVSSARAARALRITIYGLMQGVHVECLSMEELLEAEDVIRRAAEGLRAYVDLSRTFDGREEIVEL